MYVTVILAYTFKVLHWKFNIKPAYMKYIFDVTFIYFFTYLVFQISWGYLLYKGLKLFFLAIFMLDLTDG